MTLTVDTLRYVVMYVLVFENISCSAFPSSPASFEGPSIYRHHCILLLNTLNSVLNPHDLFSFYGSYSDLSLLVTVPFGSFHRGNKDKS